MGGQGIDMLVPTLLEMGTEEQKKSLHQAYSSRRNDLVSGLL
jgi:hypothetical protein